MSEIVTVPFYRGDWLVRWQTRSRVGHTACQFSDGWVYEALPWVGVHKHLGLNPGVIDELTCEVSDDDCRAMRAWAESKLGMGYDWRAIIRFVSRRNCKDNDKWFCSEYVAGIFHAGRRDLQLRTELWKMSPEMCYVSPVLQNQQYRNGE